MVAFSKYGVSQVRFTISGQGNKGQSPVDATEMTFNEQSGTYEYWTPIRGSDFASDGPITVEAEVHGHDGGLRDKNTDGGGVGLDPLTFVVNPTGSLPQVQAWVSPAGNDGSGVVEDSSRPFKSLGRAIDAIRQARSSRGLGDNADGGIVRLTPAPTPAATAGGRPVKCQDEWLTITNAPAARREHHPHLAASPPRENWRARYQPAGLRRPGMSGEQRVQCMVWADGCSLVGAGRDVNNAHPLSSEFAGLYYTECAITQVQQATSGQRCAATSPSAPSATTRSRRAMVVNCVVTTSIALSGFHADLWQHGGGNAENHLDDNVIVYNLIATRLKYQSIFIRPDVNTRPRWPGHGLRERLHRHAARFARVGRLGRQVDHLLWWHCTFAGKGMGFMSENYNGGPKVPAKSTTSP